jgi:hypothetical protein
MVHAYNPRVPVQKHNTNKRAGIAQIVEHLHSVKALGSNPS